MGERHWGDHLDSMRQAPQVWLPRWDDRPAGLLFVLKGRNQDYHHPEISEGCGVSLSRVKCQSLGSRCLAWDIRSGGSGTSLVAQWLRICLPMQGTWVGSLVWEDPTGCRATKPVHHSYGACALRSLCAQEPVIHKRNHCSGKPVHRN